MNKSITLSLLLTAALSTAVNAGSGPFDEYSRKGKGEVYGFGEYLTSWERTTFSQGAVALEFDSGFGGGIGLGYNFNDYLNLNTEIAGAGLDVKGSASGTTVAGSATALFWNVGLDYNILKKRLTPLLSAGVGMAHFTGDFGTAGSDFSETDVAWGVGGGVRWDISDHWFMKAVYRVNWTNLKDSDSATMFHSVTVGFGYAF